MWPTGTKSDTTSGVGNSVLNSGISPWAIIKIAEMNARTTGTFVPIKCKQLKYALLNSGVLASSMIASAVLSLQSVAHVAPCT